MVEFLKNKTFIAVLLSLTFFSLALFSEEGFDWSNLKYSSNAVTTDEIAHITGGYYSLLTHRYFIGVGNPPLLKDISALPLLFLRPVFPPITNVNLPVAYAWSTFPPQKFIFSTDLEKADDSWDLGRVFLYNPQNDSALVIFWARFSVIFFNSLFIFILYLSLGRVWNKRAALLSIFLLVFSQLNIAHGSLVNPDFMASVLEMITLAFFAAYLKEKRWRYFWFSGMFLSLALLTKLSSLVLLEATFSGGLVYVLFFGRSAKEIWNYVLRYCAMGLLVAIVISTLYSFQVSDMQTSDVFNQMRNQFTPKIYLLVTNYIPTYLFSNPFVKGLAEYTIGIPMLSTRISQAYQKIYFLGHVYGSEGAGATYFPVLYATKLPVGFLFLALSAFLFWFLGWLKNIFHNNFINAFKRLLEEPFVFLLLLFIAFYAVPAFSSRLQLGIRYILPIIFATTLLVASFMDKYWDRDFLKLCRTKYIFLIAMLSIAASVFFSFPYYLSYYNFFGGGTANGYEIATDSNYDWGCQDIQRLAAWIKTNNVSYIYADIPGTSYPLEYYLGTNYQNYDPANEPLPPSGSLVAMSASEYAFDQNTDQLEILKKGFVTRLGTTVFIFRVP